jgi:hypothetical protein
VPAVFLTNLMLQQWTEQGKVRLDDTTLTLVAENRTVRLTPAVRFTKLIDGGDDPHKLLGKVKTREQLVELQAEHYMDSVILGDVGYTVVEGFLGDLSPAARKPDATTRAPLPAADVTSLPVLDATTLTPRMAPEPISYPSQLPVSAEGDPATLPDVTPAHVAPLSSSSSSSSSDVALPPAAPMRTKTRAPVSLEDASEAALLSELFLSTVRDK